MSSAGMFQTQISAIMTVLAKAAVAEISQLLEEEAAALHQEIRRRNEEIQGLKARLMLTETELQRVTAESERCSVGVQVEIMMDTSVTAHSQEVQAEKVIVKDLSEEKPHFSHVANMNSQQLKQEESVTPLKEPVEEELGGLEFKMKIEQVEELVDQTLNQVQAEQKREGQNNCDDGNSRLWCSGKAFDHPENLMKSEQHSQNLTDPYVMMEYPMTASTQSGLLAPGGVLENESFGAADVKYDLNLQDSHRRSTRSDSTPLNRLPSSHSSSCLPKTLTRRACASEQTGPKTFRCEECGKGFMQRTRLITHRRVHTGEKPFRCEECGKGFTQRTWLITHRRVHTGEKPFRCEECGKSFTERKRLLTHRLVHTGEKPFRCEECGKGFTERKRLLTHRLVHTGEKPFRCQLCDKTFSRQDNCLRHMRLHSGQR
ncbi:zinc finger protein 287-like [Ctenopharyngodon idella]|uniref:zinc finger protein 287-like n=1 Tax=Ctenopharyngodon idella TaxID=7959 RepID=UPI00222F8D19|nr:zinc finger protein 287-like [Ctenopharyngodon idella]